jgi:hypothetical protein
MKFSLFSMVLIWNSVLACVRACRVSSSRGKRRELAAKSTARRAASDRRGWGGSHLAAHELLNAASGEPAKC